MLSSPVLVIRYDPGDVTALLHRDDSCNGDISAARPLLRAPSLTMQAFSAASGWSPSQNSPWNSAQSYRLRPDVVELIGVALLPRSRNLQVPSRALLNHHGSVNGFTWLYHSFRSVGRKKKKTEMPVAGEGEGTGRGTSKARRWMRLADRTLPLQLIARGRKKLTVTPSEAP